MASSRASIPTIRLALLGGFTLTVDDREMPFSHAVQRLLAFLALHGRSLDRVYVAGSLWGEVSERRAHGNLRAVLWRARLPGAELVRASATHIAIDPGIEIDYHSMILRARALLHGDACPATGAAHAFGLELLPNWEEEWVQLERERLRQLRLHALEACCSRSISVGDVARAIDFGLEAVSAAPLRESAQRSLMSAHLAEGNHVEALRVFEDFRDRLWTSCQLRPSALIIDLVEPLLDGGVKSFNEAVTAR